jgi:2-(3-amino-3-carboxypropyl)histidine synthase
MESDYDLELERAASEIKKLKARKVCIQLPDGLKNIAIEIAEELEEKTDAEILIWFGTCFGACDIPQGLEKLGVDLLIQWGHTPWKDVVAI